MHGLPRIGLRFLGKAQVEKRMKLPVVGALQKLLRRREHARPNLAEAARVSDAPTKVEEITHHLVRSEWNFGPADLSARYGSMRFLPSGDIIGYPNPNERRWHVKDGVLLIQSKEGTVTSTFQLTDKDELFGYSLQDAGHQHRLSRVILALPSRRERQLLVEVRLALEPRPLLVIFNSMGNPWNENAPIRWEYYKAANALDADILRFAEKQEPSFWYLNKTRDVMTWLRHVTAGRKSVVLAGNSSGGFAALRFAELLGSENPGLSIRTLALNPQTVHGISHRTHLLCNEDWNMLPPLINDQALDDEATSQDYDLDGVMASSSGLIEHTIAYDADNSAEAYYVSFVSKLSHVRLHPLRLGLPHATGIVHMEQAGLFASLVGPMLVAEPLLKA